MDKSEVIRELRAKKSIWERIASLTEERGQTEQQKQDAITKKGKKAEEKYQYNAELRNALPVDNVSKAQIEVWKRSDASAKKAARLASFVIVAVVLICIAICFVAAFFFSNVNFGEPIGEEVAGKELEGLDGFVTILIVQTLPIILAGLFAYCFLTQPKIKYISSGIMLFLICPGLIGISVQAGTWACFVSYVPLVFLIRYVVKLKRKTSYDYYTAADRRQLDEAEKRDAANKAANERKLREANANAEAAFNSNQASSIARFEGQVKACNSKIDQLNREINELKKQARSEILSDKDNNLETVTLLIDYLETGRADTLKEALHMADLTLAREKAEQDQIKMQWAQFQIQQDNERWARQDAERERDRRREEQRNYEYRIQSEQKRHNEQMEKEAYEAKKTLEEIQKKLGS